MEQFEKENNGITISTTLDQGEPIEQSVNTMLSKALFGALFAVLIIMLFLRNFRSTIIAIVSIPMSLLIAIIFLNHDGHYAKYDDTWRNDCRNRSCNR